MQIDKSLFWHKPETFVYAITLMEMQNHRGCPPQQQIWVFGMCDTSQSPALGVMRIVPDRSAWTLLPIMQQHLRSRITLHSDEWAAYSRVQQLTAVSTHGVVNHSLHFVDPATGVHTQNVESYVKMKFKRMKGVHETMLNSYLDECLCGGSVMAEVHRLHWRASAGACDSGISCEWDAADDLH